MYPNQPFIKTKDTGFRNNHQIIKVTGDGVVSIEPDQALLIVGTVTENKDVRLAQQQNDTIISTVIRELLTLGILRNNIKTNDYRIDIQYDYENGKQILKGYRVTHLLSITVEQIDKIGIIISNAVNNGANTVSTIQFTTSQQDLYYNKALSEAIKNAQQKAVTAAKTLHVNLQSTPIKVTEMKQSLGRPLPYQQTLTAGSEASPIELGQLQIAATVEAQFLYF
jgi:uncharacterized protein